MFVLAGGGGGGLFVNTKISQVKILRTLVTAAAICTGATIGVFRWISVGMALSFPRNSD